jgi:tetratricopeptide (TPR) repeat protein
VVSQVPDPLDPFDQADSEKASDNTRWDGICKTLDKICEMTNKVSSAFFTFSKVIIIILIIVLVSRWMFYQDGSIVVQPFETNIGTNFSEAVLANRLYLELQQIAEINKQDLRISELSTGMRSNASNEFFLSPILFQATTSEYKFHDPGSISAGGISLSPGQTILFLKELAGNSGRSLSVDIQKIGSTLSIFAILQNPDSSIETKTWEITQSLPKDNQPIEDLIPSMVEDLAFQIANSMVKKDGTSDRNYPLTWQAFKNLTKAKKAYLTYIDTKNVKYLDTASNMSIQALYSEPGYSESFKILFGLSRIYLKIGEYEKAEQLFKNIADIKPAESSFGIGTIYAERKRYEYALNEFNRSIKENPQFESAWNGKANALGQLGKYDEAIKAYDEATRLNPEYEAAWKNKGYALIHQEKYDEAVKAFNEATSKDYSYADAWNGKGIALGRLGKYNEAIKAYDEAIRLDPNYADAWNGKGIALGQLGKYDEAIKSYDEAIRLDPNYAMARNNKGAALKALGRTTKANAA